MDARQEKTSAETGGGLEEGKTEGVSFPFCLFAAPPLPFLCLPRRLGRNRKIMVFLYGNLAVLSNLALTGELHWLNMRLRRDRPGFNFLQDQHSGS